MPPELFAARIVRPLQRYIGGLAARQVGSYVVPHSLTPWLALREAIFEAWQSQAAADARCWGLEAAQSVVCVLLLQGSQEAREGLLRGLLLLQLMWRANAGGPGGRKIALPEFYNARLSDRMDVQAEYVAWRQSRVRAHARCPAPFARWPPPASWQFTHCLLSQRPA